MVKRQFEAEQAAIAKLLAGEYDLTEATKIGEPILGCMDEGIEYARLRLAASGLLFGEKKTLALVQKYGLKVGWHVVCGAAEKHLREIEGVQHPTEVQVNNAAKQWSRRIALLAETEAVEMKLSRPLHEHVAVCAYYDGTAKMTSCKGGLPRGFIISRGVLPHDYAVAEMVTAADIAFGNHSGYADCFTHPKPFYYIALGTNRDQADELADELTTHALPQLTNRQREAVKVTSIVLNKAA